MRIKKLELVGFKSFKDRTVIHFDQGITGIVGPNGCGKSNIVDALVWVMGEMSAKHLRGAQMSDVIFGGSEGFAPLGMCEVSLTLENDGGPFPVKYLKYGEIMVTRRLHRDGESGYLINKEPARLRDIHEIFMDTGAGSKGFSIIEQGAIGKIITAKPEDRRTLIEEAAGITKFKVRKRESQRKVVSTEQNLVRLKDILGEQRRQLDSLERQAQRAERYRGLKRELQEKELGLASKTWRALHAEIGELSASVEGARAGDAGRAGRVAELEARIAASRLENLEGESRVEARLAGQRDAEAKAQALEHEVRELTFEIEQARRTREMTGSMLEQSRARKLALEAELGQVTVDLGAARADSERVGGDFRREAESLAGVRARIQELDGRLTRERRELLTVGQSEAQLDARANALHDKINDQLDRLAQMREVESELHDQHRAFGERRGQIERALEAERQLQQGVFKDVEGLESAYAKLSRQVAEKESDVATFKDGLNEVASRLYGLENLRANFEGFEEGVKQVMLWQRERGPVALKPVAEIVEVPERFELAMEAALGSRLQLLVTDAGENALGALDYLKAQSKGRSSFFAADWVGAAAGGDDQSLRAQDGVETLLGDVVTIPEAQQKAVRPFFESVVVVDRLRTALGLRPNYPGRTFVTLEGDTLGADGVLTGGTAESADTGLLKRRREIKDLSQKREEWAGKLALAQASLEKLGADRVRVGAELGAARKLSGEKEVAVASLKKDLERAANELRNANSALARQGAEIGREDALRLRAGEEAEELGERLVDLRTRRLELETGSENLTREYESARSGVEDRQRLVTALQIEASTTNRDVENLKGRENNLSRALAEIEGQVSQMAGESEKSAASLSTNQTTIEVRRVELERAIDRVQAGAAELAEARDRFERGQADLRRAETELGACQLEFGQLQAQLNDATLRLGQARLKEQYLLDQINERYMMNLAEVAPRYASDDLDVLRLETEVADLKGKLGKIGDVNLSAIAEFEDISKRHAFLDEQYADLVEAKEQLKKVIDRINRICSRRFRETFELVNERFTKVFPVLFGGGEARLILVEDPENNEMGIDIVSKPPGKKLQNVSLLSGGEKALTAVSLIFSIFLVKPSPFCLLDEVDAPLDDANVFRFNDLVKEMAKRSQLIIVTHNKHTMKVNNTLYGVTMEQRGVSKMVSVSLPEAERVVAV